MFTRLLARSIILTGILGLTITLISPAYASTSKWTSPLFFGGSTTCDAGQSCVSVDLQDYSYNDALQFEFCMYGPEFGCVQTPLSTLQVEPKHRAASASVQAVLFNYNADPPTVRAVDVRVTFQATSHLIRDKTTTVSQQPDGCRLKLTRTVEYREGTLTADVAGVVHRGIARLGAVTEVLKSRTC